MLALTPRCSSCARRAARLAGNDGAAMLAGEVGAAGCDCAAVKQVERRRQARRIRMAPPLYNTQQAQIPSTGRGTEISLSLTVHAATSPPQYAPEAGHPRRLHRSEPPALPGRSVGGGSASL